MKYCPPEYWIWLQNALGAGANVSEILAYFETPEELYLAGSNEWRLSGLFTEKRIAALKNSTPSQTAEIFKECKNSGYTIITPHSDLYPERLGNLPDMPLVIYGLGDCSVLKDRLSIGIVGTRNASDYGIKTAQKLSYALTKGGATIVSGGALGIDSEAHAGAMLAKGRTMAFLGCGLSYKYLMENAGLRKAITRYGALFSEYAPFVAPSKSSFPIRNRLISGASLGIIVIEAGVKSGSLITASRALDQGKDVFAVPGDIIRSSFDGANHLIKNGAKPVFKAEDVLSEYDYLYGEYINNEYLDLSLNEIEYVDYRKKKAPGSAQRKSVEEKTKPKPETVKQYKTPDDVSEDAIKVFKVLSGIPLHIDDIIRVTGMKMNTVLSALTELELEGAVEQVTGKKYKLI
ncbi:MAG: DNA-processing protein DprA [Clostridia bacterium]|nr:DNA-processing protein DprA [Clostridia bacterium]